MNAHSGVRDDQYRIQAPMRLARKVVLDAGQVPEQVGGADA